MSKGLLISIVIPACNAELTLSDCLRSIFSQSIQRAQYEILVVDNASDDSTALIINSFGVTYIYEAKRNRGAARNAGAKAAKASLIAFVDADTILDPNWLESIIGIFFSPYIGGAQGIVRFVANNDHYRDVEFEIGSFSHLSFLFTGACAYRAEALRNVGYFTESLTRHEDVDLSFKIIKHGWVLASTRTATARTAASDGIGVSTQIEIGVAMVQILDRWEGVLGLSGWSGILGTFKTWLRQYKHDSTVSKTISLVRFLVRSSSLLGHALISSYPRDSLPSQSLFPPFIFGTNAKFTWHHLARIVTTESTTRLIHLEDRSLIIIEGSGHEFFKHFLSSNFDYDKALNETAHRYNNPDSLEHDINEILQELVHEGYLIRQER